jgi:hypothetical protein
MRKGREHVFDPYCIIKNGVEGYKKEFLLGKIVLGSRYFVK